MTKARTLPLLNRTHGGEVEATGASIPDGMDLLETICRRFPNRTTGGEGERGQAQYIAEILQNAGLDPVTVERVPCLGCDFEPVTLRISDGDGAELEALPVTFTGSTPPDGVTAELVYADDIEFVDFDDPNLRGKILLVFGWFGDYSTTTYYEAGIKAGLAGVIVIRDSEQTICYGLPPAAASCGNLPVVSISHPSATALVKSGALSVYLRVRQTVREVVGSNVVAKLAANDGKLDDRVILVSAHLDAKPVRPAAADNGAGTVMAVEVMRTLAQVPRKRDVWFAGYTDEEHGFSGSRHFEANHRDIAKQCMAQFYYDGHGTIVGRNNLVVTGENDLAAFMKAIAADISHPMKIENRVNSLDPVILFADNVPAVQVTRSPQRTWHTNHDVVDDISAAALHDGIHLYAEAVYRLANTAHIPFERRVSEEARLRGEAKLREWIPSALSQRKPAPEKDS